VFTSRSTLCSVGRPSTCLHSQRVAWRVVGVVHHLVVFEEVTPSNERQYSCYI